MQRKTIENFRYVLQDEWLRYFKYGAAIFVALFLFLFLKETFANIDQQIRSNSTEIFYSGAQIPLSSPKEEQLNATLVVPKINVSAPIIFVNSVNPDDFNEPLKRGVTHFPSSLPGEKGAAIILGHSAPFGWMGGKYEKVFSEVNQLAVGDEVRVEFQGNTYVYLVSGATIVDGGGDIPQNILAVDHPRILLITCWPPGIVNKRIIVQADIV
ncbi:MAG: sortase [Candidatus Wildermuthbacteria bacterium]|nr:sortase [Candidatus Wildermuthbacteria bacterium]